MFCSLRLNFHQIPCGERVLHMGTVFLILLVIIVNVLADTRGFIAQPDVLPQLSNLARDSRACVLW